MSRSIIVQLARMSQAYVRKRRATPGLKGKPDITGVIQGVHIEIETKVLPNKPTPKQLHEISKYQAAGAVAGVVYSLEEALELVNKGLKDHFSKVYIGK